MTEEKNGLKAEAQTIEETTEKIKMDREGPVFRIDQFTPDELNVRACSNYY